MTTRILVVNHGPEPVEMQPSYPASRVVRLVPGTEHEFYVYHGQTVTVREEEPPDAARETDNGRSR